MAIIDGWQLGYSVHPKLGKHLSASKISPTASEVTLRAAKKELSMPDTAEDCSFYVSERGVMHWEWDRALEPIPGAKKPVVPGEMPAGYEVEIHADLNALGQEWLTVALAAASAASQVIEKLGMSTSGAHFSVTTPKGANVCIHMTRKGEPKTPPHTVH